MGDGEEGMEVAHSKGVRATTSGFEIVECLLPFVSTRSKYQLGYAAVPHDDIYMDIRHESVGWCSPCLVNVPFLRRLRLCIA